MSLSKGDVACKVRKAYHVEGKNISFIIDGNDLFAVIDCNGEVEKVRVCIILVFLCQLEAFRVDVCPFCSQDISTVYRVEVVLVSAWQL